MSACMPPPKQESYLFDTTRRSFRHLREPSLKNSTLGFRRNQGVIAKTQPAPVEQASHPFPFLGLYKIKMILWRRHICLFGKPTNILAPCSHQIDILAPCGRQIDMAPCSRQVTAMFSYSMAPCGRQLNIMITNYMAPFGRQVLPAYITKYDKLYATDNDSCTLLLHCDFQKATHFYGGVERSFFPETRSVRFGSSPLLDTSSRSTHMQKNDEAPAAHTEIFVDVLRVGHGEGET